jgi:hypothetical protein
MSWKLILKRRLHENDLIAIVSRLSHSDRKKLSKKVADFKKQNLDTTIATVKALMQMGKITAQDEEDTLQVQIPTQQPKPQPTQQPKPQPTQQPQSKGDDEYMWRERGA